MARKKGKPEGNSRGLSTVLMARFSALGDVAMTVPVIYSACTTYPDIEFVLVTRPSMTGIFVNAPDNFKVVGLDVKERYSGVAGIRRMVDGLVKEYKPDIFVDLHNVLRTNIMSVFLKLKGIPTERVFKPRAKRRALTRSTNKVMLPLISQRARYREAFYKSGLGITDSFKGLYVGPCKASAGLFASITSPKTSGEKWVGIAPFAAHEGKVYPPEMMEKVVAMLDEDAKNTSLRIFLFGGGGGERDVLDAWAERYASVTSLAGKKYGFPVELALLNHLDVMLTMDSANMHLASLVRTPVISIWGATHPYCGFKGWRQKEDDTIQLPMTCRPCSVFGNKPCFRGDWHCLRGISPAVIVDRVVRYIE